jgi:hypothetical protein
MNLLQSFESQLKLLNKYYKILILQKAYCHNFVHPFATFPSLYKCLCPTCNVRNGKLFCWKFLNIKSSLLILYSLCYRIDNKRMDQFQSLDLRHYISILLTLLSVYVLHYYKIWWVQVLSFFLEQRCKQ